MSLRDAFLAQADACTALGSPFTARLCTLAAERLDRSTPVGAHLLDWPGDPSTNADSVPLRLAGALHLLVLGGHPGLAPHWPPAVSDDDRLWSAVTAAFVNDAPALLERLASPPQTNEVRRAAALIPALHMVAAWAGRPLALFELGASAGLNLLADRVALTAGGARLGPDDPIFALAPDWSGPAPAACPAMAVAARRGVDLNPLDVNSETDRLTLLSYLWADQPERRDRTTAALAAAHSAGLTVDRGDAGDWLAAHLPGADPAHLPVVFHTVAWQYFAPATQARALAAMRDLGRTRPLARIGMEAEGARTGAALTLTLWPGETVLPLGRVDFHGRWVEWAGTPAPAPLAP